MHINVHEDDQWNWEIIATRAKQNFMVTKATGKKGQTGVIGIPNIEKCTLTCVHTGFIEILDEEKNVLGTMGPGAKVSLWHTSRRYVLGEARVGKSRLLRETDSFSRSL